MHLPLLERRTPELETCAFCPKLSRAACPVSSADGRETTTPWGKMSASYFVARGAVEATREQAWPAWACTGCFACRQACESKNDVAGTLLDARADFLGAGLAPVEAETIVARHGVRTGESDRGLAGAIERARARGAQVEDGATTKLLVGCLTARRSTANADVAADTIVATAALLDGPVAVVDGCCGAPLRMAGDRAGFVAAARSMVARVAGTTHGAGGARLVVADAGCAHAIARRYPEAGVAHDTMVVHLAELAAEQLRRIAPLVAPPPTLRLHDSCALGRGLGVYEAPRLVLSRLLGRAPEEFARRREEATCSGGGGALPVTYRQNARAIAEARRVEHREAGGGGIATTCASSRAMLEADGTPVVDLATLLARSFGR